MGELTQALDDLRSGAALPSDILENWPVLSQLLDEALELPAHQRPAWLGSLPQTYAPLRPQLERLLAVEPPLATVAPANRTSTSTPHAGMVVGPFRLIREIGRGGMSSVWLAKRIESRVELPVAVKLPYLDLPGGEIAAHFEHEREILAALNHPNIARFYEAGVSAQGQPYLALEYVEGEPLPRWCNGRAFDLRRRMELFLQVLRAVQYAHASLVIHRDLKPSNIIVTAQGEVKLLDFGIARLLDQTTQHAEQTELTQLHGRLMTLDYASPEQVRGQPLTTATDVYSLGVVLYELLTGSRPYRLQRGSPAELEEAIIAGDTARPSQAVHPEFESAVTSGAARWRRALRGDLDTLVMKALEKDRTRRYASAEALAQDCERYLQGLPLAARPPSTGYRVRKFVGRHRLALGAASAATLAILAGAGVAVWQARVALEQSRLAAEEARKQEAVQSFMTSLFDKNTRRQPDAAAARGMTVRELLLEASERIQGEFTQTPVVRLELLNTVASLLRDIDEHERAAELSSAAIQTAREAELTGTDAYIEALGGQTTAARLLGRGADAIAARDEALQLLDARNDHSSLLRARVNTNTVAQFSRDPQREIALVEQAVALFEERYPTEPDYFTALYYLANLHRTQQRPAVAERYFRRAIGVFDRVGSRDFTNLGASYAFAGASAQWLGDTRTALADYERGLEILDRHAGADSLVTRFHRTHYAESLYHAGRLKEALELFEDLWRGVATRGRTVAEFDASVYQSFALLEAGDPAAAQRVLERFEEDWAEFGKRFVPNGRRWVVQLALAHTMQGRAAEAREALTLISRLPQTFYQSDITMSAEYLAELIWIEGAIGDEASVRAVLKKASEALASDPQSFDWPYARLNANAALALRTSAPSEALQYAERAVAHVRTHARRGAFPFLEARALLARGEARHALGDADGGRADLEAARALGSGLAFWRPNARPDPGQYDPIQ